MAVHSGVPHDTAVFGRVTDAAPVCPPPDDEVLHSPADWTDGAGCAAVTRVLAGQPWISLLAEHRVVVRGENQEGPAEILRVIERLGGRVTTGFGDRLNPAVSELRFR